MATNNEVWSAQVHPLTPDRKVLQEEGKSWRKVKQMAQNRWRWRVFLAAVYVHLGIKGNKSRIQISRNYLPFFLVQFTQMTL